MLISHKHKLVIYTLQRTASTSIHANLSGLFDVSLATNCYYKHIYAQKLKDYYEIKYNTQDYHKCAIIRNPIDRVISLHDCISRADPRYHYNNITEWYNDKGCFNSGRCWLSQVSKLSIRDKFKIKGNLQIETDEGWQLYVDRLFDFSQMNLFTNFISETFGRRVAIEKLNINTFKSEIDDEFRKRLENQLRKDIKLYQSVVDAGGQLIINPYQSNA